MTRGYLCLFKKMFKALQFVLKILKLSRISWARAMFLTRWNHHTGSQIPKFRNNTVTVSTGNMRLGLHPQNTEAHIWGGQRVRWP